jgi:hypothetical protein
MAANDGLKKHGKNGAIYINGPKGGGGTKVAVKTEWTLNLNRDYVDATVFGDTNKTYLAGLKDISGTYAGLMDNAGDLLVTATDDSEGIDIYLYSDDTATAVLIASGPGLVDAAINCSNTDAVRTSGNFRANGQWTVLS